jgi:phage shock protein A
LDLHVQDLESQITELQYRSNQAQATLNLHLNSRTMAEDQLAAELEECQSKYDKMDANFRAQKVVTIALVEIFDSV